MKLVQFADCYVKDVVRLWNSCCDIDMPYKPFDENGFRKTFINNIHFSYEGTFIALEDDKVVGFANGLYKKSFLPGETHENTPGYITFILVDREYRRKGIGQALLKEVEEFLKSTGKKLLQIIFFNPINLEWYIPDEVGHDHPNAPGVDVESAAYKFFLKSGYIDIVRQNSYYQRLDKFALNEKASGILKSLKEKDIEIECYNPSKHYGFNELFDDLKSELWRKEITEEIGKEKPDPIIVVSHKGKICGFTGPLRVQPSGRGYFAGIGVHSAYGGMGIGTALFSKLCENLRDIGASFMTLYTGENNPARKMYEGAGFKIVKTWADMKKEV